MQKEPGLSHPLGSWKLGCCSKALDTPFGVPGLSEHKQHCPPLGCCMTQARCCPLPGDPSSHFQVCFGTGGDSENLAAGLCRGHMTRVASPWQLGQGLRVPSHPSCCTFRLCALWDGFSIPTRTVYVDLFPPVPGEVSRPHIIPALGPIISGALRPPSLTFTLLVPWLWPHIPGTGLSFALRIQTPALPFTLPVSHQSPVLYLAKAYMPPKPSV